ncbi:hypothetical protein ACGGZK_17220 [Agromyces sp. MMS24-K17]|uniref:hypothetical protein n=1 Tax=Agromyces sp. MMS24-K17 TaxID=3372850 RepID=UPI00375429BC
MSELILTLAVLSVWAVGAILIARVLGAAIHDADRREHGESVLASADRPDAR